MEASSTQNGNVYDLIKADPNSDFWTSNYENSFIKASLKDGSTFILNKYMIRGRRHQGSHYHHLKSWKLEGERASDGKWIILDQHSNEPFNQLEMRTFNVSCEEELKTVKLTQIGYNTAGAYHLCINAFDIFGNLIANSDNKK